jgi:hypothetical protein
MFLEQVKLKLLMQQLHQEYGERKKRKDHDGG